MQHSNETRAHGGATKIRRGSGALLAPCLGLALAFGACDAEDEALEDQTAETQLRTTTFKDDILKEVKNRPSWSPAVNNNLHCASGQDIAHLLSWQSIVKGYYASLNTVPTKDQANCELNVEQLYMAVGLPPVTAQITAACDPTASFGMNGVTQADKDVLKELYNALPNLRCGWGTANQSIKSALDIPCAEQEQRVVSGQDRIDITGQSATALEHYLSIYTSAPQPPSLYTIDQTPTAGSVTCDNELNIISGKECTDFRVQTSDCENDTKAACLKKKTIQVCRETSSGQFVDFTTGQPCP